MAIAKETWVQAGFFAPERPATSPRARSAARQARNYSRVTSDPAVARAVEEHLLLTHDIRVGLARILAQRSEEEREQLRRLFAPRRLS